MSEKQLSRRALDDAYEKYNHRRYVHPDPIEFLYRGRARDRELIGLVAGMLAYGRVEQILRSVSVALERLGSPKETVLCSSLPQLNRRFRGFKHRFTTGDDVARLLFGAGAVIRRHGSLGACVSRHLSPEDRTVLPAIGGLVAEMTEGAGGAIPFLLPSPTGGSACKRLNLFVRWMVRKDRVDPGGWRRVPLSKLIVPLDTHMHRVGLAYGLTRRKSGDMKTALEITDGFRAFCPEDPVRYDFALTRMGILSNWRGGKEAE